MTAHLQPRMSKERIDDGSFADNVAWFDVTDIVEYHDGNSFVTGIQQVVVQLLKRFTLPDIVERPAASNGVSTGSTGKIGAIGICCYDPLRHEYVAIRLAHFNKIMTRFVAASPNAKPAPFALLRTRVREMLLSLIPRAMRPKRRPIGPRPEIISYFTEGHAKACSFQAGDAFVVPGVFWFRPFHASVIVSVCHAFRMRLALVVHDLIPVRCARWYPADYVLGWKSQLVLLLRAADGVYSPSRYSIEDVKAYCGELGIPLPMTTVLRWGETALRRERGTHHSPAVSRIDKFADRGFVLMVASNELRKNHRLVIGVWRRLYAKYGAATPYLVLVGRFVPARGSFIKELKRYGFVRSRVAVLDDVSNAELDELYARALFTLFPSLAEGWGLPVAESMVHGRICIAANSWSIPEVAGDLVEYVDPNDDSGWYDLIERYAFAGDVRQRAEQRIRARYQPRSWAETASALIEALDRSTASKMKPRADLAL